MRRYNHLIAVAQTLGVLVIASTAFGGAHTWRVNEAFSNASGTVQFIELRESGGGAGEVNLQGLMVKSDATGMQFTFPSNLLGSSANRNILLATSAFAALPGAPTPDHIIPANFIGLAGDTLRYHVYDAWTIGALPTDCINSINRVGGVAINSPTNYNGGTGSITGCAPPPCPGDTTGDNNVNVSDLLSVINSWGPCAGCPADTNGDGSVNVTDLLAVINHWGPCP